MLIPNQLEEGGSIGSAVSFCQFLLTWAKRSQSAEIKTYLEDPSEYEEFTSRVYGVAATYFCKKLLGNNGEEIEKPDVLRAAKPRIEAMAQADFKATGRGREIEFIFIQGAGNEFHGSLYSRTPTPMELADRQKHGELIRSYRELENFLQLALLNLNVTQAQLKKLESPSHMLGGLLSEIFRNTAEHAYTTKGGRKLKPNLRCVRLTTTEVERNKVARHSISSPDAVEKAAEYFSRIASKHDESRKNPKAKILFLELSIFDSGPGFAATIESHDLDTKEEERQAVVKCFRKHESAKSKAAPNAGIGLFKVLNMIRQLDGFMRVRTSSAEAFFAASPNHSAEIDPNTFVYGRLEKVEGSVVTICIPVAY